MSRRAVLRAKSRLPHICASLRKAPGACPADSAVRTVVRLAARTPFTGPRRRPWCLPCQPRVLAGLPGVPVMPVDAKG